MNFGLPLQIALKILILKLPGFLVLSFPMSMLLSTLLAYGKLSSNSELTALKSLGFTNKRIIIPAVFLSLLMTFITFNFNDSLVPISNRVAENTMRSSLGTALSSEEGKHIMFLMQLPGDAATANVDILKWLQENYKAEVIAYTADIGQEMDKKKIIRNDKKIRC